MFVNSFPLLRRRWSNIQRMSCGTRSTVLILVSGRKGKRYEQSNTAWLAAPILSVLHWFAPVLQCETGLNTGELIAVPTEKAALIDFWNRFGTITLKRSSGSIPPAAALLIGVNSIAATYKYIQRTMISLVKLNRGKQLNVQYMQKYFS